MFVVTNLEIYKNCPLKVRISLNITQHQMIVKNKRKKYFYKTTKHRFIIKKLLMYS